MAGLCVVVTFHPVLFALPASLHILVVVILQLARFSLSCRGITVDDGVLMTVNLTEIAIAVIGIADERKTANDLNKITKEYQSRLPFVMLVITSVKARLIFAVYSQRENCRDSNGVFG
ncbi:hypothetical protein [Dickeya zeae]|uniref:hypothetical protein n=1 Tax=Dickeya zeae TaxID=204042 RepID=UPI001315722D|nr:hypothetical protein [Dickeya zeae]UJR58345.1 hypothetical protein HJ580_09270 [Dickeya zeae]